MNNLQVAKEGTGKPFEMLGRLVSRHSHAICARSPPSSEGAACVPLQTQVPAADCSTVPER